MSSLPDPVDLPARMIELYRAGKARLDQVAQVTLAARRPLIVDGEHVDVIRNMMADHGIPERRARAGWTWGRMGDWRLYRALSAPVVLLAGPLDRDQFASVIHHPIRAVLVWLPDPALLPVSCGLHGLELDGPDTHRQCGECGHVWTAQTLLREHDRVVAESRHIDHHLRAKTGGWEVTGHWGGPPAPDHTDDPETDPEQVWACPLCSHDF